MPASSFLPSRDGSSLAEADRRALTRFLEQSLDHGFRLAIVEAVSHTDREAILAELTSTVGPRLLSIPVHELPGADANLWLALQEPFKTHSPRCLALWGFESGTQAEWARQLNVQRDLFVTDLAVPWLLFIHPASRVQLLQSAPDFCDFAILWLRDDRTLPAQFGSTAMQAPESLLAFSKPDHPLLQEAWAALDTGRFDVVRDALTRFDLQPDHNVVDRVEGQLYGARLERVQGHSALAEALVREARSTLARQPPTPKFDALARVADAELAGCLAQSGRYSEAEVVLRKALPAVEQTMGPEHQEYAAFLAQLGAALAPQGKDAEAEQILRESLSIQRLAGVHNHTFYGATLSILAAVLSGQAKHAEAERILRESLQLKAASPGHEHPSNGAVLHNLAEVLSAQGKYQEAERVAHEAILLNERMRGIEHPDSLRSHYLLASILSEAGRHPEAERLSRASLPGFEKALGRAHPDYGTALHNLAINLLAQGRASEGERLLRDSIAIKEKALGPEYPGHGDSLHALASALADQGKYAEAERVGGDALLLLQKALGPDHPRLCFALTNLATTVARQGRTREGIRLLERALDIGERALGPKFSEVQHMRQQLKQLQRRRRRL